jgi:major intrinsic protein
MIMKTFQFYSLKSLQDQGRRCCGSRFGAGRGSGGDGARAAGVCEVGVCVAAGVAGGGCGRLVGIPITGTSVNPARSLGPALIVGGTALSQVWLFIVAPLVGGAVAAGLHYLVFPRKPRTATG